MAVADVVVHHYTLPECCHSVWMNCMPNLADWHGQYFVLL